MRDKILILVFILSVTPSLGRDDVRVDGQCQDTCSSTILPHNIQYTYKFEGDLKTFASPVLFVGLQYAATVLIQPINACNFILKLSNVTLWEFNPGDDGVRSRSGSFMQFKRALEADTLNFGYDNGKLTSICPQPSQEAWVLNVKRAILSALQTNKQSHMGVVEEEDVSGRCVTMYSVEGSGMVKKWKDLSKCSERQTTDIILQGVPYQDSQNPQHIPLMTSRQECLQNINNGVMTTSKCTETHSYDPFPSSSQPSSAYVAVTSNLTFVSQATVSSTLPVATERVRKSLLYDHSADNFELRDTFKDAKEVLDEFGRLDQSAGVNGNTVELFMKLIKLLESFTLPQFQSMASQIPQENTKIFLWDAVAMVGTSESLEWMHEQYDGVDESHKKTWLASLAFIKKPSLSALLKAESFLQKDYLTAVLPYSSMYNNYLRQPGSNPQAVKAILTRISLHIKSTYRDIEEENKGIFSLKALGNVEEMDEDILERIYMVLRDEECDVIMKVLALNSLRRQQCSQLDLDFLTQMYLKQELDSELRVNAYLQRIRCMDEEFLREVEMGLEREEVNQVGSFVWTHLNNLLRSQSPLKQMLAQMLERIEMKGFELNMLKYSRNIEWSMFSHENNMGASVESNLIWSEKSFVPRSATLNLTLDLFGTSVNFLELGARTHGVEDLFEEHLSGYPQKSTPEEEGVGDEELRVDELSTSLDQKYQQKKEMSSLLTSLKVFGNEISAHHYTSLQQLISQISFLNILDHQEQNIDVMKNMKIFDGSFIVPSLVGFPLKLHSDAAASLALKLEGKVDLFRLLTSSSDIEVEGSVRPSASVVVKAEMGVNSKLIKNGIKLVSRLASNTAMNGKILFVDKNKFEMEWGSPDEKTEIITAESKLYLINKEKEVEKLPETDHIDYTKCFFERLTHKIAGVKLCYHNNQPNLPGWSLASIAPYLTSIYVMKVDTVSNYHLKGGFIQSETDPTNKFYLSFDTPGSSIDRKLSFLFELNRVNTSILIDLQTPWKSLRGHGGYTTQPDLLKLYAGLLIDEVINYSFSGEIPIKREANGYVQYKPEFVLSMFGREDVKLEGLLTHDSRRANLMFGLDNIEEQPMQFEGSLVYDMQHQRYECSSRIVSNLIKATTISNLTRSSSQGLNGWFLKSESHYQLMNADKESMTFHLKLNDHSTPHMTSYKSELSILSTQYPILTFSSLAEFEYNDVSIRTKLDIGRNSDERLIWNQNGLLDMTENGHTLAASMAIEAPYKDIKWSAGYGHSYSQGYFDANFTLVYNPTQQLLASLLYKKQHTPLLDFVLKARLNLPQGLSFRVQQEVREGTRHHYQHDLLATFDAGYVMSRIEIPAVYHIEDGLHKVIGTLKVNNYSPLEFNAALRPSWKRMKVKLRAVYEESRYGVEGNFDFGNSPENLMETDLQIEYPNYQPKISLVARREDSGRMIIRGAFQVSDHLKYSSECSFNTITPQFDLSFEWPENYATLSLRGSYVTTQGFEMTNMGEFRSSISGLEKVGIEFDYVEKSDSVESKIKFIWTTDKAVEANMKIDFNENDLTLQILTPFEKSRRINLATSTKIINSLLEHTSDLNWDDEYIRVKVEGESKGPLNFLGIINFESSYPFLDSVSIKAMINVEEEINSDFTVRLPNDRTFSILTSFMHSNILRMSKGTLKVEIPGVDLPGQQLSWKLEWTDEGYEGEVDLKLMKETFMLTSNASLQQQTDERKDINFDLITSSSQTYFNDISLSLQHQKESSTHSYNTTINARYAQLYRGYLHQALKYSRNHFLALDLSGEVETQEVHSFKLNSDNRMEDGKYQSRSHLSASNFEGGDMLGTLNYNDANDIDANFKLTTLPNHSNLLDIVVKHTTQNDILTTNSDITFNGDSVWSLETQIRNEIHFKKVNLKLATPLDALSHLEMSGIYEKTEDEYKLNGQIEHNLLEDKINLTFNLKIKKPSLITLQFNLTSPLQPFKLLNLDIAYTHQVSQKRYTISGLLEYNDHKCYLSSINFIKSYHHFSAQTIIELPGYNKTLDFLGLYILNEDGLKTELNLQTPFEMAKKIGGKLDYIGNGKKFNNSLTLHYNQHRVNQFIEFDMSTPEHLKLKSQFDSNTNLFEPTSLHFNHQGSLQNLETSLKFVHGSRNYSMNLMGKMDEGGNLEGEVGVQTPYEGYQNVVVGVDLVKNLASQNLEWKGSIKLKLNDVDHLGDVSLVLFPNNSLNLDVKFDSMVYFILSVRHEGRLEKFSTTANVQLNEQTANINLLFEVDSFESLNKIQVYLYMLSSWENFKNLLVTFDHFRHRELHTTTLDIHLPFPVYDKFTFKLRHMLRSVNSHYIVSFKTPLEHLEDIEIMASKFALNGSFQFHLKQNNQTRIYQMTTFQMISIGRSIFNFDLKLFPILSEEYSLQLESRASRGYVNAKLVVVTPIEGHREYKLICVHSFRNTVDIDSSINFSIQQVPKIALTIRGKINSAHKFDLLFDFETIIDLKVKYALKIQDVEEFVSNLEMSLRPEAFKWFQLNVGYSALSQAPDFSFKTGFESFSQLYATELTLKFNNGLKMMYALQTPFENYESFRFGLTALRSEYILELGVETNASFLFLPTFKARHFFERNALDFRCEQVLVFMKDGQLHEFKVDSQQRRIPEELNVFSFVLVTSIDALKKIMFYHERIRTNTVGKLVVTYNADKQGRLEYNLKNDLRQKIDRYLTLTTSTENSYARLGVGYEEYGNRHNHELKLQLTEDSSHNDILYQYESSQERSDEQVMKSQTVTVSSNVVKFKSGLNVINHLLWPENYVEVFVECLNTNQRFTVQSVSKHSEYTVYVLHPSLPTTILSSNYTANDNIFEGRLSLRLGEDEFVVSVLYNHTTPSHHFVKLALINDKLPLNMLLIGNYSDDSRTHSLDLACSTDLDIISYSHNYDKIKNNFGIDFISPYSNRSLSFENHGSYKHLAYEVGFRSNELFFKQHLIINWEERRIWSAFHLNERDSYDVHGLMHDLTHMHMAMNFVSDNITTNNLNISFHQNHQNYLTFKSFFRPNFTQELWERLQKSRLEMDESNAERERRMEEWVGVVSVKMSEKASYMSRVGLPYHTAWEGFVDRVGEIGERWKGEVRRFYEANVLFISELDENLKAFLTTINDAVYDFLRAVYLISLRDKLQALKDSAYAGIQALTTKLQNWRTVHQRMFDAVYSRLAAFHLYIKDFINAFFSKSSMTALMSTYDNFSVQEVLEKFLGLFDGLLTNVQFNSCLDSLLGAMINISKYLEDIISEDSLRDFQEGVEKLLSLPSVKLKLLLLKVNYLRLDEWRWLEFDGERGVYDYQFYLPFQLPSITFLFDSNFYGYLDYAYNVMVLFVETLGEFAEYISVMEESVYQSIYSLFSFQFSASVTGLSNYRTFDGRVFSFTGNCAHLLARDFKNKMFTWYVVYRRNPTSAELEKYFVVISEATRFEFYRDGRVAVNGYRKELPISINGTDIFRSSQNEIQLTSARGYSFKYDLVHDIFSLKMSGWYHGRVRGLLGWNDLEAVNDVVRKNSSFLSPYEEQSATNWLLGSASDEECPQNNQFNDLQPHDTSSVSYQLCHDLFNNTSLSNPLSGCYTIVSATNYLQMCLNDMKSPPQPHMTCAAATTYHHDCKRLNVHVRLPKYCVTCEGTNTSPVYTEGESLKIERSSNVADVVLVVREGACQEHLSNYFSQLINQLHRNLMQKGIDDRYALISYGLYGMSVHIRTIDSQVFTSYDKISQVQLNTSTRTDNKEVIDDLQAIQFASELSFRPGSSKSLIFIPCFPCNSSSKWHFVDLFQSLQHRDIALHVMHPSHLIVSNAAPSRTADVFGVNDKQAFMRPQLPEMETLMKNYITIPQDHCTALTKASHGSVFSFTKYLNSAPVIKVKFFESFSRAVSDKIFKCQECVCVPDNVGAGRSMCSICLPYVSR